MEYTWADLAQIAEEHPEAVPKIVAAICRAYQGQPGGGGMVLTTDKPLVKTAKRKGK